MSSTTTSKQRHSILPQAGKTGAPRAPVSLPSHLTISEGAVLTGTHRITIAADAVLHPCARVESTAGPVSIGRRCILRERSVVGAAPADATDAATGPASVAAGVVLGDYSTVEISAVVEAGGTEIGEGSVVGVGSRVGAGARVGRYCSVTAKSVITPGEQIPDFTVVFLDGQRRADSRGVAEHTCRAQVRQIEVLRQIIVSRPEKFA